MRLEYVPLLRVQHDLYHTAHGVERFREHLRNITDSPTGDLGLPLVAMNPVGREGVPLLLDRLLAIDADAEAASATRDAAKMLELQVGGYRTCLVAADDLVGGPSNRYAIEYDHRFHQQPYYRRGWVVGLLWTSELYTRERIREEMLECIFRAAYVERHGAASTLAHMLAQEGYAMVMAGKTQPALDREDIDYTRNILSHHLHASDFPTVVSCLYGDPGAARIGSRPLGLSARAGFGLALSDARQRKYATVA